MKLSQLALTGALGLILGACSLVTVAAQVPQQEPQQATSPVSGQVQLNGPQVVLDVDNSGRHSLASAQVEGETYKFIIDTGSGPNVIDSALAEELGFDVIEQREVLSGGVDPIMLDVVRVPYMELGGIEIRDADFLTAPLIQMSGGTSHGVLGMELFSDHLLTFNQQTDEIIVSRGALSPDDAGVYVMSRQGGPFDVTIDVAGTAVAMHVDTGAPGGFTFPLALAETLPLMSELRAGEPARMVGGERDTWLSQLDGTITLAGRAFENPPITFLDPSPASGNLGNQISSQFLMTVDQANNLIRFEPLEGARQVQAQAAGQTQAQGAPRRVGIQFGGMAARDLSTIGGVIPGSPAEAAGLRAADVIISLNGQPMSAYDMGELRALMGGTEQLVFVVDRNGTHHTFEID